MTEKKHSGTYTWLKTDEERHDYVLIEEFEIRLMAARAGRRLEKAIDKHFYEDQHDTLTRDQWERIIETVMDLESL